MVCRGLAVDFSTGLRMIGFVVWLLKLAWASLSDRISCIRLSMEAPFAEELELPAELLGSAVKVGNAAYSRT